MHPPLPLPSQLQPKTEITVERISTLCSNGYLTREEERQMIELIRQRDLRKIDEKPEPVPREDPVDGWLYHSEQKYTRIAKNPGSDKWHLEIKLFGRWEVVSFLPQRNWHWFELLQVMIDQLLWIQEKELKSQGPTLSVQCAPNHQKVVVRTDDWPKAEEVTADLIPAFAEFNLQQEQRKLEDKLRSIRTLREVGAITESETDDLCRKFQNEFRQKMGLPPLT